MGACLGCPSAENEGIDHDDSQVQTNCNGLAKRSQRGSCCTKTNNNEEPEEIRNPVGLWEGLADDIMHGVLYKCSGITLATVCSVNKTWRRLTLSDEALVKRIQENKRENALHARVHELTYLKEGGWGEELRQAAIQGDTLTTQALISLKVDVNSCDEYGWNALHIAAMNNHGHIIEMLVSAGADLDMQSVWGNTSLMRAAHDGYLEIVEILLEAGADCTKRNSWGQDALHMAMSWGNEGVVELILKANKQHK